VEGGVAGARVKLKAHRRGVTAGYHRALIRKEHWAAYRAAEEHAVSRLTRAIGGQDEVLSNV